MNICKFCKVWDRKPGGEEILLKQFTCRSLTKVNLTVIDWMWECRIY